MTVPLPNIRKIFIPDPGYMIADADLSGADAQVVAWEADDEDLKAAFRAGLKVHEKNARDVFGDEYDRAAGDRGNKGTPKGKLYDQCKRSVHLTNYAGTDRAIHLTPEIGWPIERARAFQRKWFLLHPGIKRWHERTAEALATTKTIYNPYGFRKVFFERSNDVLPEALAWGPQSVVALTCFKGAIAVSEALPWCHILLQNHDSLVFQFPLAYRSRLPEVKSFLYNPVPYPDPLIIPWGLSLSDRSWGDCQAADWSGDLL